MAHRHKTVTVTAVQLEEAIPQGLVCHRSQWWREHPPAFPKAFPLLPRRLSRHATLHVVNLFGTVTRPLFTTTIVYVPRTLPDCQKCPKISNGNPTSVTKISVAKKWICDAGRRMKNLNWAFYFRLHLKQRSIKYAIFWDWDREMKT